MRKKVISKLTLQIFILFVRKFFHSKILRRRCRSKLVPKKCAQEKMYCDNLDIDLFDGVKGVLRETWKN